jgi:hypothetical protein
MMRRNRTYANQGRTEEEQIRGALITATRRQPEHAQTGNFSGHRRGDGENTRIGREGSRNLLKPKRRSFLVLEPY